MGCMLRSDHMTLCDIYLQPEAAYDIMAQFGELGCVQFVDMTPDLNAFQRNYISEVRRLTELERILRYMGAEMSKYDIYIPDLLVEPPAMNPHDLNRYEGMLEKWEDDILEIEANGTMLMKNYEQLTELNYVLMNVEPFLGAVELRRESLFTKAQKGAGGGAAGDTALAARLHIKTGVVRRTKALPFETMLWRISRGNIYFRMATEDKLFEDPVSGAEVRKVAFLVVCQGDQLKHRVDKICTGFHANLYPCPSSQGERLGMIHKLVTRLEDLQQVLKKTKYYRCKALRSVGRQWNGWVIQVKKAKAIYHSMNLFSLDITSKCLIGQCWVPDHDLPKVQEILRKHSTTTNVASFMSKATPRGIIPTYHRTNRFTYGFQALINAYGESKYRELNPGLYTIITFPFLFAVMFGDCGHGLIMLSFSAWMVIKEKEFMAQRSSNEIWNIFFGGRYIMLFMSLFTMFTGMVYNDWFSKPLCFQNSFWINQFTLDDILKNEYLSLDPAGKTKNQYYYGVDPCWALSTNKIMFDNSIKMKLSIILGVIHMMFGLWLSLFNHIYFKRLYAVFLEFIPQVLFLTCLFMWLVFMMYFKWFTYGAKNDDIKLRPGCAPLILILFIDMALMRTTTTEEPACDAYMFENQQLIQKVLLFTGLLSVPVMLLGTPLFKLYSNKKKPIEEREDFGEIMIHQSIHTIEFVLSTISHTASYLRLWALSLAHAQLSEMLWAMILSKLGLQNHSSTGFLWVFMIFAVWAAFSISILVVMEGLSAFLHTLRLHWVEFMSKFYTGGGVMFRPFSFEDVVHGDKEEKEGGGGGAASRKKK